MLFNFNNSDKSIALTNKQVNDVIIDLINNFECYECNCEKILGFDCDKNDNHCVVKQILFNLTRKE
jgi:hypothetical protein